MRNGRTITQSTIDDIVRRIVEVAQPEKVILFGSAVRGEMGPNSDLDFLVIKSGDYDVGSLTGRLHARMRGVDEAMDFVVATPETVQRYGDSYCMVYYPALREGRVVYAA
jgi:predicted nucleotidyltransferase